MALTVYDKDKIIESVKGKLERYFGCEVSDATQEQIYHALASTVRDQVMERRTSSRGERKRQKAKKVYYLSAEFLTGRAMHNNMINLLNAPAYVEAMKELGGDILKVSQCEAEPGLGMRLGNGQSVLERYGGEYVLSCRNRRFCLTGSVPEAG